MPQVAYEGFGHPIPEHIERTHRAAWARIEHRGVGWSDVQRVH